MFATILLASVCAAAPSQYSAFSLREVRTVSIPGALDTRMALASDDEYDYLATPAGLFRFTSILTSAPQVMGDALNQVNRVATHEGAVYVLRQTTDVRGDHAVDHALLRSTNRGETFVPIDAGIEDCFGGYCMFLPATEISFAPGRIFLGAGGNVLVSGDNAATWKILHGVTNDGRPELQSCPTVFHRIDQRLLMGGECPLDNGFVRGAELKPDLLGLNTPLDPVATPEMQNRNVQFITSVNGVTYAGIEGALMKSCDDGKTFDYVIYYPLSGTPQYPYIHQFLASSLYPGLLIVGGFDKAQFGPYLAWSADNGEHWTDASAMVPAGGVALIAEGNDGRPFIVVQNEERAVVMEVVVKRKTSKWSGSR